jgi:hypothetical protein
MIKVRVLDSCEFCDGEAYIFDCEDVDSRGETYDRYRPCEVCQGSGNQAKWVTLREFADLIERATRFEPDYLEQLCYSCCTETKKACLRSRL